jgi:Domain of unknown function (DUF4190)
MSEQPSVPQFPQHPQYPPPYNLYAILSLVISLVVFPPVGIYLGYKAKEQIAQTGERGIEMAKIGIVVGWVLTSVYAVFMVCGCGFLLMGMGSATFNAA